MRSIIGIILGIFFLVSCAQVQSLTGGDKDKIAPKPIEKRVTPANQTTLFIGNSIRIPFDEFVKLNNPTETIVMIPPHAKIKAKLDKKTLLLTWQDTLQENTTYTIYLNQTIKDITEGNDSLMTYVFSTGTELDSLNYQVKVIDAYTNQPKPKCLVGLYQGTTDSVLPTYFIETNATGIAEFKNLKSGDYSLLAFEDANKDLLYQIGEKVAFRDEKVTIGWNENDTLGMQIDTIPLRIFSNPKKPKLNKLNYKAPSYFSVGSTVSLKECSFFANGNPIEVNRISDDSLSFIFPLIDTSSVQFIATSNDFTDTTFLRILPKEKAKKFTIELVDPNKEILPSQEIKFYSSDYINRVDSLKVAVINKDDSTNVPFKINYNNNNLSISFDKTNIKNGQIKFKKDVILTASEQTNDSLNFDFVFKKEKELGIVNLNLKSYENTSIVVEVLSESKLIKTISVEENYRLVLAELKPGKYSFRVILDENKNGKWDTGDFKKGRQPEIIHTFSTPTDVRANWEIDVELNRQ